MICSVLRANTRGLPPDPGNRGIEGDPLTGPLFAGSSDDAGPIELCGPPCDSPGRGLPSPSPSRPRNAFGDGRHATTWLCLRFLLEVLAGISREGRAGLLFGAGTGTGVSPSPLRDLTWDASTPLAQSSAAECAAHNIRENGCAAIALHSSDIASFEPRARLRHRPGKPGHGRDPGQPRGPRRSRRGRRYPHRQRRQRGAR